MAKLTAKQLTDLLSKLGAEGVELVENDTDADFNADDIISSIDKSRLPIIRQLVHKDIHGELSRKINGNWRKHLSEITGIPVADIAELESDKAASKAIEYLKAGLPDTGKEAQARIDEILKRHAEELSKVQAESSTKLSELESRLTRKSMLDVLARYHKEATGLPEKANREKLAATFLPFLEGNGILKLNEAGDDIEIYDRNNPDMKLLNSSKTATVSVSDFMKPYYSELGIWNEDTRDIPATTAARNTDTTLNTNTNSRPMANGNVKGNYASFKEGFK